MMGIVVAETCSAYKKYNKIISDIYHLLFPSNFIFLVIFVEEFRPHIILYNKAYILFPIVNSFSSGINTVLFFNKTKNILNTLTLKLKGICLEPGHKFCVATLLCV
jgi:hypothetical protein